MVLFLLYVLSALGGLIIGFIFGSSHSGLFAGLFKGIFIGAICALDLHLLGGHLTFCWCLFGTSVCGSLIATYTSNEHPVKKYFDLRRPLDL